MKFQLFHGGCHGCNMQAVNGLGYCVGCRYFECNWFLPDLNDQTAKEKEESDAIRAKARELAANTIIDQSFSSEN